jgi:uncharacterized iron-regulated membrane protein
MRQVWHRNATRLHKWIALIVGVQLFLWTASGLFMTIFPIEEVRGEHLVRTESPLLLDEPFVMPVFDREPVIGLALRQIDGRPVLVVEHPTRRMMHDPYTGAHIMSPDATGIRERAARVYKGSGEIEAVTLIESDPPGEYRGRLPVWQVQFDDGDALRLYLDPATGEVITRRTRLWRVYDFMWMLHIMDYDSRDDFNNPLVQVAAGLGLSVALSGLLLLFYRVLKPDRRRISRTA